MILRFAQDDRWGRRHAPALRIVAPAGRGLAARFAAVLLVRCWLARLRLATLRLRSGQALPHWEGQETRRPRRLKPPEAASRVCFEDIVVATEYIGSIRERQQTLPSRCWQEWHESFELP